MQQPDHRHPYARPDRSTCAIVWPWHAKWCGVDPTPAHCRAGLAPPAAWSGWRLAGGRRPVEAPTRQDRGSKGSCMPVGKARAGRRGKQSHEKGGRQGTCRAHERGEGTRCWQVSVCQPDRPTTRVSHQTFIPSGPACPDSLHPTPAPCRPAPPLPLPLACLCRLGGKVCCHLRLVVGVNSAMRQQFVQLCARSRALQSIEVEGSCGGTGEGAEGETASTPASSHGRYTFWGKHAGSKGDGLRLVTVGGPLQQRNMLAKHCGHGWVGGRRLSSDAVEPRVEEELRVEEDLPGDSLPHPTLHPGPQPANVPLQHTTAPTRNQGRHVVHMLHETFSSKQGAGAGVGRLVGVLRLRSEVRFKPCDLRLRCSTCFTVSGPSQPCCSCRACIAALPSHPPTFPPTHPPTHPQE